jgi:hypothetical protein
MTKFTGPKAALDAAQSPDASQDLLRELASSEYPFVRAAVASHPKTEVSVLESLLPLVLDSWRDVQIADALAGNARTPARVLAALADRVEPHLGEPRKAPWALSLGVKLCAHPHTPMASVRLLFESPRAPTQFRKVVARDSHRPEIRALAANDRSEIVRRALARSTEPQTQ